MKKIVKVLGWLILTPILLFVLLAILLYIPPVQNFVVHRAMFIASEATGMDIRLERLRLKFPLDVNLQGVQVLHETGDTLVTVRNVLVDIGFRKLFHGEVGVDAFEIKDAYVNTCDLIEGLMVKGQIGRLFVDSHGVRFFDESVIVNNCELADTDVSLSFTDTEENTDTVATTSLDWVIALQRVSLGNTRLRIGMPGDSLRIGLDLSEALLSKAVVDLKRGAYTADSFDLNADTIRYDVPLQAETNGLDVNHLKLSDVGLRIDSIRYETEPLFVSMSLRQLLLTEKCGLKIDALSGYLKMDTTSVDVTDWLLRTPNSRLNAKALIDFDALRANGNGRILTHIEATLGKADLLLVAGDLPQEFVRAYPAEPVTLQVMAEGNMDTLRVTRLHGRLPSAFDINGTLEAYHLMDSIRRKVDSRLLVQTRNLNFVKGLFGSDAMHRLALPPIRMNAYVGMERGTYKTNVTLQEGKKGRMTLKASYNINTEAYDADVRLDSLQLHDFLPTDSLNHLTARVTMIGSGIDFLKRSTHMKMNATVTTLEWGHWNYGGMELTARLARGDGQVVFNCMNDMLRLHAKCNALLHPKNTDLTFSIDLEKADLYALHLVDSPFATAMELHVNGGTNLKNRHKIQGDVTNIRLMARDTVFHPKDVTFDILMRPDTLYAHVGAGDLLLNASGRGSLENIIEQAGLLETELNRQLDNKHIDHEVLRGVLPDVSFFIHSGRNNPVANILSSLGYSFHGAEISINADPSTGLNGEGHVYAFNTGAVLLDTIQWQLFQDSTGVNMDGRVCNGPKNKQFVFDAQMKAYIRNSGARADIRYRDEHGVDGVKLGVRADLEPEGVRFRFVPMQPIIAYRRFRLNENNYIFWGKNRRVEADVDLLADDGTGLKLYSTPNEDALQDLSLTVNQLNLGELTSVMPYAPDITGFLHGDVHLLQTEENLSVMSDIIVQDLVYEGAPIGKVALNAVYLPNSDGSHYVDGIVSLDDHERITLAGKYTDTEEGGDVDAEINLLELPISLVNGFVSSTLAQFTGTVAGDLTVSGPLARPVVNGGIGLNDVRVKSAEYSLNLRVQDDTIRLDKSKLTIDALKVYSLNNNPLVMNGTVDFRDLDKIKLDAGVKSTNFELINAPRTQQASAYGKVYVDVNTTVKGTLDKLAVRGRLNVLGNTDVTYVLKDSPLTVDNRLSDLVEFVDFSDSTEVAQRKAVTPLSLDVVLSLSIDQAAQVNCMLNADHSNYVELEGGGDLTLTYAPDDELLLNGRYTVLSGEMKYSLPIIPLKTFTLKSGSYVEFAGDPANPNLNISATERVRATVTENDVPRTVSFDVGLSITQNLDNMGLEFTLDAPEDMNIRNELASMSNEQRGRLAVTMLATGMYLANGNLGGGGGFSTQSALNSFLQSEINSIAGNALKTIDLSVGMENTMTADGSSQTDYSFRFAKRFWGNRVSLIIGGKVSTGEDVENTGQTLIDNVSLEYRLDKSATRYVKLFYDKNYESILEGELTEMGVGLVLRRKMTRLGELFIFRRSSTENQDKSLVK